MLGTAPAAASGAGAGAGVVPAAGDEALPGVGGSFRRAYHVGGLPYAAFAVEHEGAIAAECAADARCMAAAYNVETRLLYKIDSPSQGSSGDARWISWERGFYAPAQSAACESALNAWCAQHTSPPVGSSGQVDAHAVARVGVTKVSPTGPGEWRCYAHGPWLTGGNLETYVPELDSYDTARLRAHAASRVQQAVVGGGILLLFEQLEMNEASRL